MEWGKLILVQAVSLAIALVLVMLAYKVLGGKSSGCSCGGAKGAQPKAGGEVVVAYNGYSWT